MSSSGEDYSVIGDKGEIGFIDYENDTSVCNYNPEEEGPAIISVPFPLIDGKPQSVFVGETAVDSITLRNTTDVAIDIWGMNIYASSPEDTFTLSLMKPPSADSGVEEIEEFLEFLRMEDRLLQPFEILTVWVSCKPEQIGLHTSVVQFSVGDDMIERVIFLLAEDKITQSLTSKKPYMKGMKKKQFPVNVYVDGQRPMRKTDLTYRNRLPRYDIPKQLREPIENKELPDAIYRGLTRKNYVSYFEALLIMEEIELEECMKRYAMVRVTMKTKMNHFLTLEVPGLAERRPSLVHGDQVFVMLAREDAHSASLPYQGYIHHVEAEEIYLKFARDFHMRHRDENLYNVQFAYNRINMRRLYQAITATRSLDTGFLFPSTSSTRRLTKSSTVTPISMKLNDEQMRSVEMILCCKGAPPYVIHGPPGTGKTVTLVEAILQLYTTREDTRILVCAPSNSAADYLLEKIISQEVEVKENEMFRLNATTRNYEDVNPDFIQFCYFDDHIFKCPPLDILMRYRIIISTYMSASLLYAEGMKRGHFSHIFLDEAGQASEPETMIPISSLSQRNTVVVLAGDPMQLGPVVHSSEAEAHGLGKSYMERMFESPLYSNGDNNYITKLVRNYRCHPEILHLPSMLFYEGQLVACRDDATSFTSWSKSLPELFPNENFPVLFLGIQGSDEREGKNPSWFNRFEISKVVEVIEKLAEKASFKSEDIGVITPYRQQVNKINDILEGLGMPNIKVGSVEQFQGQEKKIIIVSTVRSTFKHNGFDKLFCLGFLTNPKRFNVAITRAISSLIIVGNPHIISKDPYWNQLLWHCADNNSYQGCQLPERQVISEEEPLSGDSWKYEQEGNTQDFQHGWSQEGSWKYEGEGNQQNSQYEWSQDPLPDIPKPVTDEAEWSDGWK